MGNCIKRQSQAQWAGEDWEPAISPPSPKPAPTTDDLNSKKSDRREVKVKVTKKQLEEVIKKMKMEVNEKQGLTVQQLLEQLIKTSEEAQQSSSPPWKPKLQTIPEFKSFHSFGSDRSLIP